jgi:hypothetical protein
LWQVQERGYFQLKPEWWEKFDPLFAQFYLNELEDAQVCRFIIVPTSCTFHDKILDARIDNISCIVENREYLTLRVSITISARTANI